jgi:hypothetical protein
MSIHAGRQWEEQQFLNLQCINRLLRHPPYSRTSCPERLFGALQSDARACTGDPIDGSSVRGAANLEPGRDWSILASMLPGGVYSWQKHQELRDGRRMASRSRSLVHGVSATSRLVISSTRAFRPPLHQLGQEVVSSPQAGCPGRRACSQELVALPSSSAPAHRCGGGGAQFGDP